MRKGDTVKYTKPENDVERGQRFELLDDTDGLTEGSAVKILQFNTGFALPTIFTVHFGDIIPAND